MSFSGEGYGSLLQRSCWEAPWTEEPGGLQPGGSQERRIQLSTQGQERWGFVSVASPGSRAGSAAAWPPACLWLAWPIGCAVLSSVWKQCLRKSNLWTFSLQFCLHQSLVWQTASSYLAPRSSLSNQKFSTNGEIFNFPFLGSLCCYASTNTQPAPKSHLWRFILCPLCFPRAPPGCPSVRGTEHLCPLHLLLPPLARNSKRNSFSHPLTQKQLCCSWPIYDHQMNLRNKSKMLMGKCSPLFLTRLPLSVASQDFMSEILSISPLIPSA